MAGLTKSVVIHDEGSSLEDDYVSTIPKTTPAGYKVVRARYLVEHVSVWIVPDNIDERRLWCRWDDLMYADKDGKRIDIEFEKVVNSENFNCDAFKYPSELKICVPEQDELDNEDMFFDCEDAEIDEDMLKTAREAMYKAEGCDCDYREDCADIGCKCACHPICSDCEEEEDTIKISQEEAERRLMEAEDRQ